MELFRDLVGWAAVAVPKLAAPAPAAPGAATHGVVEVHWRCANNSPLSAWGAVALVSDVDADGVYSVHYVDKQGQLCTQRAGGLVVIAPFGRFLPVTPAPGFAAVPSNSRPGQFSYVDPVGGKRYASADLTWHAYLRQRMAHEGNVASAATPAGAAPATHAEAFASISQAPARNDGPDPEQALERLRELGGCLCHGAEIVDCVETLETFVRRKLDLFLPEWRHAEIVEGLTQQAGKMQDPFGIWLAGGPGSGKGHVLRELAKLQALPSGQFAHLDVDAHREYLPAWKEDANDPKLVSSVERTQYEAGYINDLAMARCARQRINFVVDGTMRKAEHTQRNIQRMREESAQWKNCGARGNLMMRPMRSAILFVDADVDVCLERVASRAAKTGRPVQEDFVKECNQQCRESVKALSKQVNLFIHVKNNRDGLKFVAGSAQELKAFAFSAPHKLGRVWV